jgi:CRISPR-associated protein Cas8a1/Csx13
MAGLKKRNEKSSPKKKPLPALAKQTKKLGRPANPAASSGKLTISLNEPGMTPLLRAGLGGLAASVHGILVRQKKTKSWPVLKLEHGRISVAEDHVIFEWGDAGPAECFRELFELSFCVNDDGIIWFPGTLHNRTYELSVLAGLQRALKKTFLQHGKTTEKRGDEVVKSSDDGKLTVRFQPYASFAHQSLWQTVVEALTKGPQPLAGWAYPGAAQRHVAYGVTKAEYSAAQILAASFAVIGCVVLESHGRHRGGIVGVPEPDNLLLFAEGRAYLTPERLEEVVVTGPGDAVLYLEIASRLHGGDLDSRGFRAASAVTFRQFPWDKKQKYRGAIVRSSAHDARTLDLYDKIIHSLPTRVRDSKPDEEETDESSEKQSYFHATSALRSFATENIALSKPWYAGFSIATDGSAKKSRFIHYFRDRDRSNLGALYPEERKGLIKMEEFLEEDDKLLVQAVHVAIKQRFGRIREEAGERVELRNKRWDNERERLRLAFAGSKTLDQMRAALADLFSRAGANKELQVHWPRLLKFMREPHWQQARDLSLVALASYRGAGVDRESETEQQNESGELQ